MKYRMYVDEVGNSDLESSENPQHRFLSLTGVIFDLAYIRAVVFPEIEDLKSRYFDSHPDDPIILHRKELLNARYPFSGLRNPEIQQRFDRELLAFLEKWEYSVITVCMDKKNHKETYSVWKYDPYHYCLALLLERFTFFLEKKDAMGDVMAESRGGKEDRRLKDSFARLWSEGTQYISNERFEAVLTSKELKVKPKKNNIAGLQIADLLAHPSRNEILFENKQTDRQSGPFGNQIINILSWKYYQNEGKVFGKKFI